MTDRVETVTGFAEAVFGYLPSAERLEQVASRSDGHARAIVVGAVVSDIFIAGGACRIAAGDTVALPEGLYWFEGIDGGALLMHVEKGEPPGASRVAPLVDLEDDDPLMAAWQWAEHLWESGLQVPGPLFDTDDHAVTRAGDADVVIRGRRFVREWMYTVAVDGKQQIIAESRLSPRPVADDPVAWVAHPPTSASRFGATLTRAKLQGRFSNTLFSFRSTRTTFRPYQFKPILKLLQTGKARILIADEVGLGKTIEAGLLWTELDARRDADRVLIVSPSSLVEKWIGEMRERFGFELTRLDGKELAKFLALHQENRLPRRASYIASLESLRTWDGLDDLREFPPHFDLVVIDEAHSMRNRDTKSYALGAELSDWAANMVFLTATPINLRQDDLLSLLELLSPEDIGDLEDLQLRLEPNRALNKVAAMMRTKSADGNRLVSELSALEETEYGKAIVRRPDYQLLVQTLNKETLSPKDIVDARRYLAELNTLSTIITRTKKVEVDDRKATRRELRRSVSWTDDEARFYEEFLSWCDARAKDVGLPLYFAMQMPLRLASACLPMARQAVLDPDGFGEISDADDSTVTPARLAPHSELIAAATAIPDAVDSKFDVLLEVLEDLDVLGRSDRRVLLFTHSRKALSYLRRRLADRFRVALLHGGVGPAGRLQVMADFRAGAYDLVLANRVASEGLDFEFCSVVINYDLPWNPMEVEQRIGRIDRIGQPEETILIVNFVNEKTIDERIMHRLLERIEIFESAIGQLELIIGRTTQSALEAAFDFTLTPDEREQKVHEALTAIEEQRAGVQDVADASGDLLVASDVDVTGLEEDLVQTGRYLGQRELALLIDDWACTDGAGGVTLLEDENVAEVVGNARMASRLDDMARRESRQPNEHREIATQLRHEAPIRLVLDQERARTRGGTLITATHPLSLAAASVPGHRQARFASLALTALDAAATGSFLVLLAKAEISGSDTADKIWGSAVTLDGRSAGDAPVEALMAGLAGGALQDQGLPVIERIDNLVTRAIDLLMLKQVNEQDRRDQEFAALQQARLTTLRAQHDRKAETIQRRIDTATARRRDPQVLALFRSQLRRAEFRRDQLIEELSAQQSPEIMLEYLAVCAVSITRQETAE